MKPKFEILSKFLGQSQPRERLIYFSTDGNHHYVVDMTRDEFSPISWNYDCMADKLPMTRVIVRIKRSDYMSMTAWLRAELELPGWRISGVGSSSWSKGYAPFTDEQFDVALHFEKENDAFLFKMRWG